MAFVACSAEVGAETRGIPDGKVAIQGGTFAMGRADADALGDRLPRS
jgi:hypothetical protein